MLGEDDELLDVRRSPRAMLDASAPPVCLAGPVETAAAASPLAIHRAAVSAGEALRLYRVSLQSEREREVFAAKAERVARREEEARAALQWLGGIFETAGDSDAAWRCGRMARLLVSDNDLSLRDVESWEAWLHEAAEGHAEADAEEEAALRRLDQRREEDGPHVRLW